MKGRLYRRQVIPGTARQVFPFFDDPVNLERITPRWLGFRITEAPPSPLRRGSRLRYRLRLWGVPVEWHTLIDRFHAGRGFVDTQVRGPYVSWVHVHFFTPLANLDGRPAVLMEDRVDYELPFGPLGRLAAPFVAAQLDAIFRYRRRRVEEFLGTTPATPADSRLDGAVEALVGGRSARRIASGARWISRQTKRVRP